MYPLISPRLWPLFLWVLLMGVTLLTRPLLPVDETRYIAVAWEMWDRHDFRVPYLNGSPYSHKPPLLFWLMHLGWRLFGVNEWSARLIAPAFSLATVYLIAEVAKLLWPTRRQIGRLTAFILSGCFFWIIYSTLTMFDMLLAFFVSLGVYSILKAAYSDMSFSRWLLLGLAIGGGLLSKGPVVLLHLLPLALLAPWWRGRGFMNWSHWYGGVLAAITTGVVMALTWAIPAGMAGGDAYRKAIFLGQTQGRLVNSFAHSLPWWWYFQSLPLLLLPWLLWPPLWNGTRLLTLDKGLRFCISWVLPVFAAFSLISGKRLHYLLPLMPGVALIIARAVDGIETFAWQKSQRLIAGVIGMMSAALLLSPFLAAYWPWLAESAALSPLWGLLLALSAAGLGLSKANSPVTAAFTVCAGSVLTAIILSCAFFQVRGARYDMTAPSREIAALLAQNKALVYPGKYHGQYNFYGRLERGLMAIDIDHVTAWAQRHPEGFIVRVLKDKKQHPDTGAYSQYPYRNKTLAIMPSESFLVHHGNVNTRSANRN